MERAAPLHERSVTVIIAAHDAEETIGRAVSSALAQSEAGEVIVIDDASSDATAAVARELDDGTGRLRVIRLKTNRGPSAARNIAIVESTSPILCILDADDFMIPGRLGRMLACEGGWDLLADDISFAREGREDAIIGRLLDLAAPMTLTFESFVLGNIPVPGRPRRETGFLKPLIRRDFMAAAGLGYNEDIRLGEDFILYAQALAKGARYKVTPDGGYVAVERQGSLSGRHQVEDLAALLRAVEALFSQVSGARRRALGRHRRMLRNKLTYRRALEAKKSGAWGGVLARVLEAPLYILAETLRARRTAAAAG